MLAVFSCTQCGFNGHIICNICGQRGAFSERTKEAIFCDCGHGKLTTAECRCGNQVSIANINLKSSFNKHWLHWTWILVIAFIVIQLGLYNPRFKDDNAMGAIANNVEAWTSGAAIGVISIIGALLTSWLPALLTQSLFSPGKEHID